MQETDSIDTVTYISKLGNQYLPSFQIPFMIKSVLFDVSYFKAANVFQNPHFLLMSKTICVFAKGIFVKNRCVLLFGTEMQGMKSYCKLSELPLVLMQAGISRANPL